MHQKILYEPFYRDSHALVIGIDKYRYASPLAQAVNDATQFAHLLQDTLGFYTPNVTLLTDCTATRANIMASFMRYASHGTDPDDRLIVFYAGHGHTVSGHRGETGFLVPSDGKIDDLSTLVRWDEITNNADLIRAKHIFFLMDACYGGLALKRSPYNSGTTRLREDMMRRFSRQVLTAGKADEAVSDGGGSRPGHSIFTSHLLDAMEGAAGGGDGMITANKVMAYVYEKVGNDPRSGQSPHYGFLEGDGDFIIAPVVATPLAGSDGCGRPPPRTGPARANLATDPKTPRLPSGTQGLRSLVARMLNEVEGALLSESLSIRSDVFSAGEFTARVCEYEEATENLEAVAILLARRAGADDIASVEYILKRLAEVISTRGGVVVRVRLGWYPILRLMYAAGISAILTKQYDVLRAVLYTTVGVDSHGRLGGRDTPIILPTLSANAHTQDYFKALQPLDGPSTARSEYLFRSLRPSFCVRKLSGRRYEAAFDQFEAVLQFVHSELLARSADGLPMKSLKRFSRRDALRKAWTEVPSPGSRETADSKGLNAGTPDGSLESLARLISAMTEHRDGPIPQGLGRYSVDD